MRYTQEAVMEKKKTGRSGKPIGDKILSMRKKKGISIEGLSEMTGLTIAHLENIETGNDFAPVGDILKISRALTVDPGEFLQPDNDREKELEKIRIIDFKKREEAYHYEVLTPQAMKGHLRSFRVTIPAHSEHPGVSYQHEGEEFVYVLDGVVDIQVGQKNNHLKKNQTHHFNSGIRHSLKNPGAKPTILIVTIYTP
jgi:transcriptional regulator with XRE-family HTH domain